MGLWFALASDVQDIILAIPQADHIPRYFLNELHDLGLVCGESSWTLCVNIFLRFSYLSYFVHFAYFYEHYGPGSGPAWAHPRPDLGSAGGGAPQCSRR